VPSLENDVEPPDANNNWLPEATAENWVDVTPLPQAKAPQLPLEEVRLEAVPERV